MVYLSSLGGWAYWGSRSIGGLQVGGGINDGNALEWIEAGASKVCVQLRPPDIRGVPQRNTCCCAGHRHVVPISRCEVLLGKTTEDLDNRRERQACSRCQVSSSLLSHLNSLTPTFLPVVEDEATRGLLRWTNGSVSRKWKCAKVCW